MAIVGDLASYGSGVLEAVLRSQAHRGPDGRGVLQFDGCLLAHTRLSIIDVEGGAQPMADEARATAISYNGEIYNYQDIRSDLESRGHVFRTRSDTEVILKAYAEFGEACVERFDGMFAFALWDDRRKALFVARDRFGEKPLFHARDRFGNLLVASEIKALLAAGIESEIDRAALDHYLFLKYTPRDRSIYRTIHVLPPAHRAAFQGGAFAAEPYWRLTRQPCSLSYDDARDRAEELIRGSVRKRLIGEATVGAFLSGGIDSTLIAAMAQERLGPDLQAYSIGYGGDRDELPFASEVAQRLGIPHHVVRVPEVATGELEKTVAHFDEPHGDTANLAQQLLSRLAARHGKVALAGDGADELFLGYDWYREAAAAALPDGAPSAAVAAYAERITIFPAGLRRELLGGSAGGGKGPLDLPSGEAEEDDLDRINRFDIDHYLSGQLLPKVDLSSMMHGLEVRCPFLDHELAQFAYSLPRGYKLGGGGKRLLRDLVGRRFPGGAAARPKQGFGAPLQDWMEAPAMRAYVLERLGPGAKINGLLCSAAVARTVEDSYRTRSRMAYYRLWLLLCLELWLSTRPPAAAPPA